jgi:hypothetical protein
MEENELDLFKVKLYSEDNILLIYGNWYEISNNFIHVYVYDDDLNDIKVFSANQDDLQYIYMEAKR